MTSVADETKVGDFQEVIRIDEEQLRGHLQELVRESVEETLERDVGRGGRRPVRGEAVRAVAGAAGHAGGALRAEAADAGSGEMTLAGAAAAEAALRDGDHRALSPPGIERRGGVDADVSGGRVGASGGGHHRGAVGPARQPQHGQRAEPEDLRDDRSLAAAADRGRARLRVPGRDLAEAFAGAARCGTSRCWWP